ncbi:MAG: FAD-dependent oxidoreductase [Microgenomates group bacterium]
MNVAIIGGGITGLSAAYELTKRGAAVTVFEKDESLGGLANGFSSASWSWKLEKTYHHFFTNDRALISLARELGLKNDMLILSPTTSIYLNGEQHPFDTPLTILKFPGLPFIDRVRTGMTAALMKCNPFWKPLEHITAKKLFQIINGKIAWQRIWEPLLDAKFGPFADKVAASWLWARLYKRTPRLGYFRGGFSRFVEVLADAVKKNSGTILTNTTITAIKKTTTGFLINERQFDAILYTVPSSIAAAIGGFDEHYKKQLLAIPHLWAQTLILETKKPILNKTYWLNINDRSFPFLAVVDHTNMIASSHYGGNHICYVGNYLPDGHAFITKTKEELLALFFPYLKKIAPHFSKKDITNMFLFTVPNAQPVHTCNYSKCAPVIVTPYKHIYLANLDSIYPWDRGTNYAVEFGKLAAHTLLKKESL